MQDVLQKSRKDILPRSKKYIQKIYIIYNF